MFRIRSASILEPKIANYPLTYVTKCIVSFQTLVLTLFLTGHVIYVIATKPKNEPFENEEFIRFALYVSFVSSLITFFIALKVSKWPLVIPIFITEVLLCGYTIYKIVDICIKEENKAKAAVYIFFCVLIMAESPLVVFLSFRVLLYIKTMARAVKTTRQLSYVGSITKESLRKEEEMVRMQTIKRRGEGAQIVQTEPRISIISLPMDESTSSSPPKHSIPHIEVSDA